MKVLRVLVIERGFGVSGPEPPARYSASLNDCRGIATPAARGFVARDC